jgi:hypothetical protein
MGRSARRGMPRLLLLCGALVLALLLGSQLLPAMEVSLRPPKSLAANLPLKHPAKAVHWSPDGRFLSITASEDGKTDIVVLSSASGETVGILHTPGSPPHESYWDDGGILWVQGAKRWSGYRYPFNSPSASSPLAPPTPLDTEAARVLRLNRHLSLEYREASAQLSLCKDGKLAWTTPFHPHEGGWSRIPDEFALSPDGSHIAFTVSGWVSYECPGAEELWTLDTQTGRTRLLHTGAVGWGMWDFPVQSLTPSWSADSRSIAFGDDEFGLECIALDSGRRTRLLLPTRGYEPRPGNRWVVTRRQRKDGTDANCVAVSRDGRRWGEMQLPGLNWYPAVYEWDPTGTRIAVVGVTLPAPGAYSVLLWQVAQQ